MNETEYVIYLSPDGENRYRHHHRTEGKRVLEFRVQHEAMIEGRWYAIVRYDTAHGFAHRDVMHPYQPETKTEMAETDYPAALTAAERDLKSNWKKYREQFEAELKA